MAQTQQMTFGGSSLFVRKQTQECPASLTKADALRLPKCSGLFGFNSPQLRLIRGDLNGYGNGSDS
jgi:hypothetical protein